MLCGWFAERMAANAEIKTKLIQHFLFCLHNTNLTKHSYDFVSLFLNLLRLTDLACFKEFLDAYKLICHKVVCATNAAIGTHGKAC